MRCAKWFLLLLVVCQLCLGSAWAHVAVPTRAGHASAVVTGGVSAHCHDGMAADVATPATSPPADGADASCCGATHCPLCGAVGVCQAIRGLAAVPQGALLSAPAAVLVSWMPSPELRPPI